MESLRKKARELLESGAVSMVVGFQEGSSNKVRALFARKPEDCNKLIWDNRCLQNLAVYIVKPEFKKLGKLAIVSRFAVLRNILQLVKENQITDENIVVLGISDDGKLLDLPDIKAVDAYVDTQSSDLTADEKAKLAKYESLSREERWKFWVDQFSKCIKCYACRSGCPLCYCAKCACECNQPQWIPVAPHALGNLEWHIIRTMHLAGRCINCGDCERACPVDIPLTLLYQKAGEEIFAHFGSRAGTSSSQDYSLSSFKTEDKEDFIR